jgi:hypothetical protein
MILNAKTVVNRKDTLYVTTVILIGIGNLIMKGKTIRNMEKTDD